MSSGARWALRVALALPFLQGSVSAQPVYDLLLKGGVVVDGSGAARFRADVAIALDRIAAVEAGIPGTKARRVLDVAGLVVAPGFIDNHAHLVTLEAHPDAENFLRQGITTILAPLHSQDQPWPLDAYAARVRMAPNVGLFAGHTWIRRRVMGLANRDPTADELDAMRALVDASMRQGALGFATGLEYVPASFSKTEELVALAKVAAGYGGIYVTHLRDEGPGLLASVEEALRVGREAGMPVQINHHKATGAAQFGWTERSLALIDKAAAEGLEVAHDVYPYTAFSTYSDLLLPAWSLADGPEALRARAADPAQRARILREMREIFPQQAGAGPESVQIGVMTARPELRGRSVADYLKARGRPLTLDATVEALLELQLEGGFIGIFHAMDEGDVERILRHPLAMIETDGDLVKPGTGFPHPRSYGAFPRVLSRYVREQRVLTLEAAIRKMTSMPARFWSQDERGLVRAGMLADVVAFDADKVRDLASYTDPHHYSTGVVHVLVNGTLVLDGGALTGAKPGRFLPRKRTGTQKR